MNSDDWINQGTNDYFDGHTFPPSDITDENKYYWNIGYNAARRQCIRDSVGLLIVFGITLLGVVVFCYAY